MGYLVHSPRWALGSQKIAQERGVTCYAKFPGHPAENYADIWDFVVKQLTANQEPDAATAKTAKTSAGSPRGPKSKSYIPEPLPRCRAEGLLRCPEELQ
jgi:hypothetical protein